jgi:hypothetical protein
VLNLAAIYPDAPGNLRVRAAGSSNITETSTIDYVPGIATGNFAFVQLPYAGNPAAGNFTLY